jgi:hypothetical protein
VPMLAHPCTPARPARPAEPRRDHPAGSVRLSRRRPDAEFDHGQFLARSALPALHSAPRDGGRAGSRWGIPHLTGLAVASLRAAPPAARPAPANPPLRGLRCPTLPRPAPAAWRPLVGASPVPGLPALDDSVAAPPVLVPPRRRRTAALMDFDLRICGANQELKHRGVRPHPAAVYSQLPPVNGFAPAIRP